MDFYDLLFARKMSGGGGGGGGGSDEWKRPADWPDISKLDRTGTVVYATYRANYPGSYYSITTKTNDGSKIKVALGHIVNGEFVVESETEINHNATTRHIIGVDPSGYKVLRVTEKEGSKIKGLTFGDSAESQYYADGIAVCGMYSSLLELYGNLPNDLDYFTARTNKFLESFDITNARPSGINFVYAFSGDDLLQNWEGLSTFDTTNVTSFDSTFRVAAAPKGFENWNTSNVTNMSRTFQSTTLKEVDLSRWDMSNVSNMGNMFYGAKSLESVKINGPGVSCTPSALFQDCQNLKEAYISDTSKFTDINSIFRTCNSIAELDLSDWDLSSVTSAEYSFNSMRLIYKLTLPSTLSVVGKEFANNCYGLMEIHFKATTPPSLSATNPFPSTMSQGNRKIYVPYSADHSILNAYKTATNWSTYASYIFEEEQ